MKTHILDEISHVTYDHIEATEQVQAVKPLRPTLEDLYPELVSLANNRIRKLLSDAEALNDEIEHLKAVAQRAQAREVEAVKRCEALEAWLVELGVDQNELKDPP